MSETPVDKIKAQALEGTIIEVLRTVYDPELPINIYDLGLIYGIDITPEGAVTVRMTLTTPACPVAGILPMQAEEKIKQIDGVKSAKVEIVWEPTWNKDMMSDAAKLQLGMDIDMPKGERIPGYKEQYDW